MSRGRTARATGLLMAAVLLTGCGGSRDINGGDVNGVDPDLTLEQAKQTAMEMELALAAMIPGENVASIDQSQMGVLLSCDDQRGYQWTGGTNVVVRGSVDSADLVSTIIHDYSNRDGYTAENSPTPDGAPGAHVLGEHGAGYLVNQSPDKTAVEILSFSPCFVLPDDMSPRGEY